MGARQDVVRTVTVLQRRGAGRRLLIAISGLVAAGVIASACGSSASPAASGGGGSSTTLATATALVKTTQNTKLGTILVNSKGLTLYHFTADTATSACTGSCASVWPPLLMSGNGSPVGGSGITGLGTIQVAAGRQVTYRGMPLYTYSGDKSPGQTNGQGIEGKWFAVVTSAAPAGGATTTTAKSTYGY